MKKIVMLSTILGVWLLPLSTTSLSLPSPSSSSSTSTSTILNPDSSNGRRSFFQQLAKSSVGFSAVATTTATSIVTSQPCWGAVATGRPQTPNDLKFQTTSSGLQWADIKVGTGNPLRKGSIATIDYSMSTTGARYGTKIYSTANTNNPYRFTIGDGSTIEGIEQTIVGDSTTTTSSNGMEPMLPGGIRRLIVPSSLGYQKLAINPQTNCVQSGSPGPIPPPNDGAFEEYQRFKNIYCNPNRQYQPDLVLDIKLYGPR